MNFYRRWGRFYIDLEFSLGIGRLPKFKPLTEFEQIKAAFELNAMRNEVSRGLSGWINNTARQPDEYAADDVPHPFQDEGALTGNVVTPAGAQSGEVLDVTRAAYVPEKNWVDQTKDGS